LPVLSLAEQPRLPTSPADSPGGTRTGGGAPANAGAPPILVKSASKRGLTAPSRRPILRPDGLGPPGRPGACALWQQRLPESWVGTADVEARGTRVWGSAGVRMAIVGNLNECRPGQLFRIIAQGRRSGRLTIQGGNRTAECYFRDGRLDRIGL